MTAREFADRLLDRLTHEKILVDGLGDMVRFETVNEVVFELLKERNAHHEPGEPKEMHEPRE